MLALSVVCALGIACNLMWLTAGTEAAIDEVFRQADGSSRRSVVTERAVYAEVDRFTAGRYGWVLGFASAWLIGGVGVAFVPDRRA